MNKYSELIGTPSPYTPPRGNMFIDPIFLRSQTPYYGSWKNLSINNTARIYFRAIDFLVNKYESKGAMYSSTALRYDPETDGFRTFEISNRAYISQQIAVDEWLQMMWDRKCKIIFIYCSVRTPPESHANWIIVDKVRKIVEFYDPNGAFDGHEQMFSSFKKVYCCEDYQTDLCFIPKTYKLVSYEDSCPKYGFQIFESTYGGEHTPEDLGGYCKFWSLFMLDMRLANLHLRTKHVQEMYLERVMDEAGGVKEMGKAFRKFIRQYVQYWSESGW